MAWAIFSPMDLELECFLAVVNLRKANCQRELTQYQKVLSYATPDMEAFDILLKVVEQLVSELRFLETKLKEL